MANKVFKGMSGVAPQDSRAPRLQCGFHVVEITSARIFATRKGDLAAILELEVCASNAHRAPGVPVPAHPVGSEASIYLALSGRELNIIQREIKSLILAALGIDIRTDAGKTKLQDLDDAKAWEIPIGKKPCLTDQCLPEDGSASALVGRQLAIWGRPKGQWTNYFYEVWNEDREAKEGLPAFDANQPPEMPEPGAAPF